MLTLVDNSKIRASAKHRCGHDAHCRGWFVATRYDILFVKDESESGALAAEARLAD